MTWKPVLHAGHRLILLGLAAIGFQPADAQDPIESSGPYLHRAAGAVFPVQIGDFRRAQILRYDEGGRDISASYNLATPQGRLLITVYIYPAAEAARGKRTKLCEQGFESATEAIRKQYGSGASIEEGRPHEAPGTHKRLRHRATYRVDMKFDGELRPVRTEAHLYCYVGGDWFVKCRVSAPMAVTAPVAVGAFIRSGPWPGPGSAETVARAGAGREGGTPPRAQR